MRARLAAIILQGLIVCLSAADGAGDSGSLLASFQRNVQPVLEENCYDCHGDGSRKGGVQLDGFGSDSAVSDHQLWLRVMRNVRTGIMPPADRPRPTPEEKAKLFQWIKREALGLDPRQPDPGRVTVRRLNRVEYRNTVRELLGVDYDTQKEFPADDTGQGFDNIADVLTISPMLLEKYLDAAQAIVAQAVPVRPKVVAEQSIAGRRFSVVGSTAAHRDDNAGTGARAAPAAKPAGPGDRPPPVPAGETLGL